jgi:hypothetical protein
MTAVYSAWLLVAGPKHMPWNVAVHVKGCREPKQPKRDFVSNGWRRRRNQCGKLVEESSVNSTKDSLDEGKKIFKKARKEKKRT